MGLGRKLYVNWLTKKRQLSDASAAPDPAERLSFSKYDIYPLEIVIVEPVPGGGPNAFKRVDITDLALDVAINDTVDDATPLAEQTSWTKNTSTNCFSGNLTVNTVGMNTYLGSPSTDKQPYFEIQVTNSSGARVKILSELCDVKVGVLQTTSVSPDPAKEYLTRQEQEGLFVQRILGPGETITFRNTAGNQRTIGLNEDGTAMDNLI